MDFSRKCKKAQKRGCALSECRKFFITIETLDLGNVSDAILDLKTRMEQAESLITQLWEADTAIEGRIAALEALKENLVTKDWVTATFATLEAQEKTAADLAKFQALLAGLPEGKTVVQAINSASEGVKGWVSEQLRWKQHSHLLHCSSHRVHHELINALRLVLHC